MSDLIDRQAAIKVCEHHKTEGLPCKNAAISMCIDSIEALPSAQPEPLTVTIDYEPSKDVYDRLKQAMRDSPILLLPSAQPEIIRCKDCKHKEREQPGMVYCPMMVGSWVSDDHFCAWGERKDNGND